jgi:hypothetical protein
MSDPEPSSGFACAETERENAARAARIDQARREEIVNWAMARAEELRRAEHEATLPKAEPAPARRSHRGADMTREWQDYIADRIKQSEQQTIRAIMEAVNEGDLRVHRARNEKREEALALLRAEIAELRAELAELRQERGQRSLRAVPSTTPGAMIA